MLIWKPNDKNDVINKTMAKFGHPGNQTNYLSFERFDKSYPKCTFYWIWAIVSKVMGIYVKFWFVLPCTLIKYDMSCDLSCKFEKSLLWRNSAFNFMESHKISGGRVLYSLFVFNYQTVSSICLLFCILQKVKLRNLRGPLLSTGNHKKLRNS